MRDIPRPDVPDRIEYTIDRELPAIAMRPITESPESPAFSTMEPDRQARAILWFTARQSSVLAECRAKHDSLVNWIERGNTDD